MRSQKLRLLGLVILGTLLSGCGDAAPTSAVKAPNIARLGDALVLPEPDEVLVVQRIEPLIQEFTVSQVIGSRGGTLEIREAGVSVRVPPHAVGEAMTMTLTARAGSLVAFEFAPHGVRFAKALKVELDLKNTSMFAADQSLSAGYFPRASAINDALGTALIEEILPTKRSGRWLSFEIVHFSGYLVSSGRGEDE